MATKKAKSLTLAGLKKEAKKLDKMITVDIDGHELKIYENFTESRLGAVTTELIDDYKALHLDKKGDDITNVFTPYLYVLLIKHVTSLDVPNDIEGKIETIKVLTDLGIFGKILEAMPEGEIEKFTEKIKSMTNTLNDNMDLFESEVEDTEFENDEIDILLK